MQLTVYTTDGGSVHIEDMKQDTVQSLIEAFEDETTTVLMFALDDESMTYINRCNVTRIDIE